MNRLFGLGAIMMGLALVAATAVTARDENAPSIKDIMTKAHKGGDSILGRIRADLKDTDTNWADVTKESKELVKLGTDLSKAKPEKGEAKSWKKLTDNYIKNVKTLQAAAEKKDKKTAQAAVGRIGMSCGACHKAHKPARGSGCPWRGRGPRHGRPVEGHPTCAVCGRGGGPCRGLAAFPAASAGRGTDLDDPLAAPANPATASDCLSGL